MSQSTDLSPNLSPTGVERITAALAGAGVEVHYTETDGDHHLDLHLRPIDDIDAGTLAACWYDDRQGWRVIEAGADGTELNRWPIGDVDQAAMVAAVGEILAEATAPPSTQPLRPGLTAAMTVGRELLAAGWAVDHVDDGAHGSRVRDLIHPSGREITTVTAYDDGVPGLTSLTLTGLDLTQVVGAIRGAGLTGDTEPADRGRPVYAVDFAAPVPHSSRPGMVAGLCGHGVAPSEYRVGLRYCERCPVITSSLTELLPELRPLTIPASEPLAADDIALQLYDRIVDLVDRLTLADEGDFEVHVDLARGEVTVFDAADEDLVLARGVITGPGVAR